MFDLEKKGAVDVGEDTTEGDSGTDQGVELFITADSELEMARGDTLHLEVLGGVLWRDKMLAVMYDFETVDFAQQPRKRENEKRGGGGWDDKVRSTALSGEQRRQTGWRVLTPANSRTSAVKYSRTAVT